MDLAQPGGGLSPSTWTAQSARRGGAPDGPSFSRAEREAFRRTAAASAATGAAAARPQRRSRRGLADDLARSSCSILGHGGIDRGAACGLAGDGREGSSVLSFARSAEESGWRRRAVTGCSSDARSEDVFVSSRRPGLGSARSGQGGPVHLDPCGLRFPAGQDVRGLTVYTGSERASDAELRPSLADRENTAGRRRRASDLADGAGRCVLDILQELTSAGDRGRYSHGFATPPRGRPRRRWPAWTGIPRREAGFQSSCEPRACRRCCWNWGISPSRKDFKPDDVRAAGATGAIGTGAM